MYKFILQQWCTETDVFDFSHFQDKQKEKMKLNLFLHIIFFAVYLDWRPIILFASSCD